MLKKPYSHYAKYAVQDPSGPYEGGVCLWLYKIENGEVFLLFQKRALSVNNGGFYDSSAGGHIDEGEDPLTAILRETKEEIGLEISKEDLRFLTSYIEGNKYIHVYLSDRTGQDDLFTLNYDEVDSIEWVSLADFDKFVEENVKPPLKKDRFHLPAVKRFLEEDLKKA